MKIEFRDRREAGKMLAERLNHYAEEHLSLLALPRGGVPVGYEVAKSLNVPLGVFVVRKLGVPGHEEFAMGAIASGGLWFVNQDVVRDLGISRQEIQRIVEREQQELKRRTAVYESEFSDRDVRNRTVILVDDGLATGSTMKAAVRAIKQEHPEKVVVAVPVASPYTCDEMINEVDDLVCIARPDEFRAVGEWYEDFSQTSDEEVRKLLEKARPEPKAEPVSFVPWPMSFTA